MSQRNVSVRLSTEGGQRAQSEIERFGRSGQRSLNRVRDGARPASQGLVAVNQASREVQRGLEGVARQAGPVGSVLAAIGPGGLAAAAAIAGVTSALSSLVSTAEDVDQRVMRLEAVLTATGNASGVTARQVRDMAQGIAADTLAAAGEVEEAAARLATFGSIGSDAFERTLRLAQDMSAVFGGDLRSNTQLLARSLEDPERRLDTLERRFGSFSQELRDNVSELIAVGDQSGATEAVLEELERRIGGAGAAEAGGVRGAADGLSQAWTNFNETLAETINLGPAVERTLRGVTHWLERATEALSEDAVGEQLTDALERANEARQAINEELGVTVGQAQEALQGDAPEDELGLMTSRARVLVQEYEQAQAEIARIEQQRQDEGAEQREAEAGRRQQLQRDTADAIRGAEQDITDGLRSQTETRRDVIQREFQERIDQLRGIQDTITRNLDAGELEPRDAIDLQRDLRDQIMAAQELRDVQLREIEEQEAEAAQRAEQAAQRRADAEASRVTARLEGNARVIAEMERELDLLTELTGQDRERARFVDQAVGRLQDPGQDRVAQVRDLATALFEERQAQEEANEIRGEAERLAESTRTAEERFVDVKRRLRQALDEGTISQQQFNAAVEGAEQRILRSGRATDDLENTVRGSMQSITQAITGALIRGEDAWESFGQTAINVLDRIAQQLLEQAIVDPVVGAVGGAFGGGGGQTVSSASLGPEPSLDIPSFASGGMHRGGLRIVGERGPELEATGPARIWSADQTRNALSGGGGGGGGVVVNIHNEGNPVQETGRTERVQADGTRMIDLAVRESLQRQGNSGQLDPMFRNLGLRPRRGS